MISTKTKLRLLFLRTVSKINHTTNAGLEYLLTGIVSKIQVTLVKLDIRQDTANKIREEEIARIYEQAEVKRKALNRAIVDMEQKARVAAMDVEQAASL